MIGRTLTHYRIEERLGAGGMGEVYRAHDEKLGRDVALKVLPTGALADEDARRRFRKEAEILSRLNHPHIAGLLDADSSGGSDFLVMELVPGATLEEELRKGPLAEKDAVRLGAQLARGLMAAHERGVVHRDLKPSNLGLTADGLLKVLDFGVAHLERGARAGKEERTATQTGPGAVVGSPPYMSPEQLLGKEVDARSDLYAAGAVLYELVTGARPFGTKRGVELHDAVLHDAPLSPRELDGRVTPGLEAVILKALDKDPGLRYQTARELLVDLERLQSAVTGASQSVANRTPGPLGHLRGRRALWLASALAVSAAAVAWWLGPSPALRISGVRPVTRGLHTSADPFWASDGTRLYYSVTSGPPTRLYQIPIAGGTATEIPTSFHYARVLAYLSRQGALLVNGTDTPDSAGSQGRSLWLLTLPAGSVRRLGNLAAWEAAVSPDEEQIALLYGPPGQTRIGLARADGSGLREVVRTPSSYRVSWASDGQHLRFAAPGPAGHEHEPWTWETSLRGEAPRPLWPGAGGQRPSDGRHFVFPRGSASERWRSDLWAVREAHFPPWPRPEPVRLSFGPISFFEAGLGPDGRLFAWGELPRGELLRWDARARRFEPYLGGVSGNFLDVSPDGQWAAYAAHPEGELWRSRTDGSEKRQLTFTGQGCALPRWSPDGRSVAFVGGPGDLRRVSLDGSGEEVLVRPEPGRGNFWDVCWLPDGETLVFSYMATMHPGVLTLDLGTKRLSTLPGAEKLIYPKCSRRGDVMAFDPTAPVPRQLIRWRGRADWEPVDLRLGFPNWTRDAEALIGFNNLAQRAERFSFKTRTLTVIADLSGIPLVDPSWMGLAPDDSPLVLCDHGVRDLYALELSTDGRH